jgi:hypothetical protein
MQKRSGGRVGTFTWGLLKAAYCETT